MLYIVAFAAILCIWSLLLILSGERQRQISDALAAHPQLPARAASPAPSPAPAKPVKSTPSAKPVVAKK